MDYHDTTKVGGIDLPMTVRSSRFADIWDITGMDPLQVPLWKLLYNLYSAWIRKLAHGREVFVVPLDTIGMTVFFAAELSHQLKSRNIDIDRLP